MIERTAKDALIRLASQFPVIGVTGPRQSGKSTLTQATFPDKRYVTFDDKNMRELAASNPSDFIMAFPNGAIIDEAQKVPEIFDAIKLHVDRGLCTGQVYPDRLQPVPASGKHDRQHGGQGRIFKASAVLCPRAESRQCTAGQCL